MAKVEYPKDPIVEKVLQRIAKRADQGLVKFGCPIGDTDKTLVQWLRDIQEEMMDACVYIERAIKQNFDDQMDRLADRESK